MIQERITNDDAQYALELVKKICEEVGPGLPGSPQERERAAVIEKELKSNLGDGNVVTEKFSLAPGAFLGSLRIGALFLIGATVFNIATGLVEGTFALLTASIALAFSVVSLLTFLLQFLFGFEFVDSFFRKKQSENVIGTLRKPGSKEVKRLILLSGHHDSAWENNWLRLPGYGFFIAAATPLVGMAVMLGMCIVQLTGVVSGNVGIITLGTLGWFLLAYPIIPSVVLAILYNVGSKNGGTVPGAADNLAASALTVAMSRFLVKNPEYIPANTEIRFISFGSEEAGCRGSRRYVETHLNELRDLDSRLLNMEIIAYPEIGILTTETNGTVKNSPELVKSIVVAADRAGVPYKVKSAYLGVAGDAGPFSRVGLKAVTLNCFKVPKQFLAFYHQKSDRPEVLTLEPLMNVLKLASEWIRNGGE